MRIQVKISERVIVDNNEHTKTWETVLPYMLGPGKNDWGLCNNAISLPSSNKLQQDETEYMEIDKSDLSENNEENTDTLNTITSAEVISKEPKIAQTLSDVTLNVKPKYEETKKKCRPLVPPTMKDNRTSTNFFFKFSFFMLLPILIFLIAALFKQEEDIKYTCDHELDYSHASIELQHKIYGQDDVMESLGNFLKTHEACKRIALLVGHTGVGKSYTIEIIRKNFPIKNNILHYFPPLTKDVIDEISPFRCNLVVFENLKENDITDVIDSLTNILKLENRCVTVLAVFNVPKINYKSDRIVQLDMKIAEIKTALSTANVNAHVFGYKPLTEEALEKCIEEAMRDSNLTLNKNQIEEVKQSVIALDSGCKGAYAKVQVIGRE